MIGPAHHIGIAVKHLDEGIGLYGAIGIRPESVEDVPSEGVRAAFLDAGGIRLELLESLKPDGVIGRFIAQRGEGLHHVAFATDDIRDAMEHVQRNRMELVDAEPRRGAHGRLVAFVHPRSAHGVLLELVQEAPASPQQR